MAYLNDPGMESQRRARDQTTEEWLQEYTTEEPVRPAKWDLEIGTPIVKTVLPLNAPAYQRLVVKHPPKAPIASSQLLLRYEYYKTTKQGRLLMIFSIAGGIDDVVAWFNVSTKKQRSTNKLLPVKTGVDGYFYPQPRSNFRKFWEQALGKSAIRWGAVYRSMSRFNGLDFTGEIEEKLDAKGERYFQVNNLRLADKSDVSSAQFGYKTDTNQSQVVNSDWEQANGWRP